MSVVNFPIGPDIVLGERIKDACCPVCGDTSMYFLWIDSRRPMYCPGDPAQTTGGPRTITDVEQCPYNSTAAKARNKAALEWLKQKAEESAARMKSQTP